MPSDKMCLAGQQATYALHPSTQGHWKKQPLKARSGTVDVLRPQSMAAGVFKKCGQQYGDWHCHATTPCDGFPWCLL
jgi:hypothetical protein